MWGGRSTPTRRRQCEGRRRSVREASPSGGSRARSSEPTGSVRRPVRPPRVGVRLPRRPRRPRTTPERVLPPRAPSGQCGGYCAGPCRLGRCGESSPSMDGRATGSGAVAPCRSHSALAFRVGHRTVGRAGSDWRASVSLPDRAVPGLRRVATGSSWGWPQLVCRPGWACTEGERAAAHDTDGWMTPVTIAGRRPPGPGQVSAVRQASS